MHGAAVCLTDTALQPRPLAAVTRARKHLCLSYPRLMPYMRWHPKQVKHLQPSECIEAALQDHGREGGAVRFVRQEVTAREAPLLRARPARGFEPFRRN